MKIIEKLAAKKPSFSFEFFPPKDEEGKQRLFETVADLGRSVSAPTGKRMVDRAKSRDGRQGRRRRAVRRQRER